VTSLGNIWCWGEGSNYRLGTGTNSNSLVPVQAVLPGGFTFEALGAKMFHGCAIDQHRNLWCWGDNTYGQCGDGTLTDVQYMATISEP